MTAWLILAAGAWLLSPGTVRYRLRPGGLTLSMRPRRRAGRGRDDVVELVGALRDELLAGAALRPAFERAASSVAAPVCPQAVAVSRMGGDVAQALRGEARGEPLLLSLAALWQVCEGSGGALAAALDRLIEGARQGARVRREVAAQLAGPRATSRVLAGLPVIGVGMGLLMGADPLGFLFGTVWGWVCLLCAILLEVAGMLWMRRLVRGIESQI